jgi:hypothetical protein
MRPEKKPCFVRFCGAFEDGPYAAVLREESDPRPGQPSAAFVFLKQISPRDVIAGAVVLDLEILVRMLGEASRRLEERKNHLNETQRLPEGSLHAPSLTKSYRVDGRDDYTIEFVPQGDGTYKLYARRHPSDPWGKSSNEHHLFADKNICVSAGKGPRTLDQAKAIAMVWCNGWSEYCRTGTFPKGGRRVDV